MTKPDRHILVCGSFRTAGAAQGACVKKNSHGLLAYLQGELGDRGMGDVKVTLTGCLNACDRGPILVVYPDNTWYGKVEGESDVDAILDALEAGSTSAPHLLT